MDRCQLVTIISLIFEGALAWLGGALAERIWTWLHPHLEAVAAKLPDENTYESPADAKADLFDAAIAAVPAYRFPRRLFLRRMKALALAHADGSPLTTEEHEEVNDLASNAS